jgi:hypothetical protein
MQVAPAAIMRLVLMFIVVGALIAAAADIMLNIASHRRFGLRVLSVRHGSEHKPAKGQCYKNQLETSG